MSFIHPTAVISAGAIIGEGSSVGPYSVIGPEVVLGRNNRVGSHVVIEGITRIGDDNQIYQFASVGAAPQDLKYHGERSELRIGNKNLIREYVTLQPGTSGGRMATDIGDGNLFMACSHVGHDGVIGNGNVIANSVALAGHVEIGNYVTLGGLTGIHQFVRIGDYALLGAGSMVPLDIPPYCVAQGDRAGLTGINQIGLERRGYGAADVSAIKELFRSLFVAKGLFKEKLQSCQEQFSSNKAAKVFLDFVTSSKRGVTPLRSKDAGRRE
ncbi:MAG: acyl-ACP--UDP-N-acetylglucosamine O-acyltransferase [Oligoflexia bacterium]|nr:acyl-ACP--UDP-N-acetylglucosamine O-acyltransferase [Oligoflexia bacterium]